jgi:MFS family permease
MAHSPRSNDADGLLSLPRPVWLLGWVSLATDSATEAIYPLLPFFLTRVLGAGAVSLGVVEGAAEAVNSLLKIWSGRLSDRRASKRPLVIIGYSISSLVRPLIAVAQSWTQVLAVRVSDRVGKGIRSAPRDAILATFATPTTRGKVYGFHRAMDHSGAVLGPVLATAFLYFYPGSYRTLFALTIVPGAIAVALIFFVREHDTGVTTVETGVTTVETGVASGFSRMSREDAPSAEVMHASVRSVSPGRTSSHAPLPRELKLFFLVLTLFTLGNSTDAFLLLKLTDVAGTTKYIPLIWAALHVVKATVSVVGGSWSDRVGRRTVIALGWLIYAAVYVGFALSNTLVPLLACFLIYGFYFGFAEGVEKALVADLAPAATRGFAFGVYNAVLGIGALLASVLFGLLWNIFGASVAFGTGAALALVATALLFGVIRR